MPFNNIRVDALAILSITLILILAISVGTFNWTVEWGEITPLFLVLTTLTLAGLLIRNLDIATPSIRLLVQKLGTSWSMLLLSLLLAATGALASSVLASAAFPYVDDKLHAADRALGFDWKYLLDILIDYPHFFELLSRAYGSIALQQVSLIALLSMLRPSQYIFRFVFAWALGLTITVLLFPFFPAVAAFDFYQIDASSIPVPTASAGWNLTGLLDSIRSGADNILNLDKLTGPVTMPSLHAAAAVMFAYAFWTFRYLRLPALALNVAMWFSSITVGAHYLVDLIAGSAIALLCIKTAKLAYPEPKTDTAPSSHG